MERKSLDSDLVCCSGGGSEVALDRMGLGLGL